ncbi:UNVERIFIED_CONTAM: hypothetical protein Sradi_2331200 [Sesamum radiatum]|uniref:Reverse transcriptase domain-containing protein n=1 Tax=Sesamum radiatum TaxID=300843 RepID=A0AAW2T558_SESRA
MQLKELEERFEILQSGQLDTTTYTELGQTRQKIEDIQNANMLHWQQRSKMHLLKDGDGNTKFFHSHASAHHKRNHIKRLKDSTGVWKEREADIQEVLLQYFQAIFASTQPANSELNEVLSVVQPRVTTEMNRSLAEPFTSTEVKQVVFGKMNHTHVVLIPKCESPKTVGQLRPISLCNIILKIASKCIANRLKPLLDHLVSQTQSAFIPGRLITDYVLVAFELNHHLRISIEQRAVEQRLIMSKVYDRVEWSFLKGVLLRSSFVLDAGCGKMCRIVGVAVADQAPRVSHLLFADDTLVFCEAVEAQIGEIGRILNVYKRPRGSHTWGQLGTMSRPLLGVSSDEWEIEGGLFQGLHDQIWDRLNGVEFQITISSR